MTISLRSQFPYPNKAKALQISLNIISKETNTFKPLQTQRDNPITIHPSSSPAKQTTIACLIFSEGSQKQKHTSLDSNEKHCNARDKRKIACSRPGWIGFAGAHLNFRSVTTRQNVKSSPFAGEGGFTCAHAKVMRDASENGGGTGEVEGTRRNGSSPTRGYAGLLLLRRRRALSLTSLRAARTKPR